MISLILPTFNRHHATDRALILMAEQYPDLDLEVVIVDDGSETPYLAPYEMPWPVRVDYLRPKSYPLNPCVPINWGVLESRGEFIALSSPEILHVNPVLEQMRDAIIGTGPSTYVTAAVWCPEQKRWHAHSTRRPLCPDRTTFVLPEGSQYHFLSMMTRTLWDQTGGFDLDYRDGAGYDDDDFVMRLARAGARFVMRDDLIVEHPKEGARSAWTTAQFHRNRGLFLSKWRTH